MSERDQQRIRRFLERGPAILERSARPGVALLDGGDRGRIAVTAEAMAALASHGAIVRQGAAVRLARSADSLTPPRQEPVSVTLAEPDGICAVTVNQNESPLAMLRRRKDKSGARFLTEEEFLAGERLRVDYERACIMPRLGVNWDAIAAGPRRQSGAGGMAELSDAVIAARRRVDSAIGDVGPELAGVLIDICCFLKGLEKVEAERRWPARSAKLLLKAALGALARHYAPPARPPRSLHWGDAGYRPTIA